MLYKKYFKEFMNLVDKKNEKGFKIYSDKSFYRKGTKLVDEIEQELLDICGWSMILWIKIRKLRKKVAKENRTIYNN